LAAVLQQGDQVITVDETIRQRALIPLQRMLDFSAELKRARGA
ncbi:MAG: hypothetical protein Q8K94_02165, partial [Moraxellaceae bacterium]|nr:hypothetical protein [Moraxellaceae bacterium]